MRAVTVMYPDGEEREYIVRSIEEAVRRALSDAKEFGFENVAARVEGDRVIVYRTDASFG